MALGTKWEHVECPVLTFMLIRRTLLPCLGQGPLQHLTHLPWRQVKAGSLSHLPPPHGLLGSLGELLKLGLVLPTELPELPEPLDTMEPMELPTEVPKPPEVAWKRKTTLGRGPAD